MAISARVAVAVGERTRALVLVLVILLFDAPRRKAKKESEAAAASAAEVAAQVTEAVYALNEIQKIAALQRFELERGDIDAFAELMTEHWKLSRMIDAESTNTLIDQIFDACDDLLAGKMICGAGGGGFLQVILKKGVSKEQLHKRIKSVFSDTEIGMWACSLV